MKYHYIEGQTPLDLDEKLDLIPSIITREDLNACEQENIMQARQWIMQKSTLSRVDLISEDFIKLVHKKMYGRVWKWAGKYRRTNKNIGVDYYCIPMELKKLLDDIKYWIENDIYTFDDLAIVLHHRLVKIHLFPNGNGRHARLYADAIAFFYTGNTLSWGMHQTLYTDNETRKEYIKALRLADQGEYSLLILFAKS